MRLSLRSSFFLVTALSVVACSAEPTSTDASAPSALGEGTLKTCFGYRGNGTSVFATMGGIARLFEEFGEPAAVVGTSSGSVASFLTESLMVPNDVYECAGCSRAEVSERKSFMLKAFPLVLPALASTEELASDLEKVEQAKRIYDFILKVSGLFSKPREENGSKEGVPLDPLEQTPEAVQKLFTKATLTAVREQSREIRDMIHPRFYEISGVGGEARPDQVRKVIENVLNFQGIAKENTFSRKSLMYPGLINFDYLFRNIGVLADWYAGYGADFPRSDVRALLDVCAKGSRGQWWNPLADRPYGTSTCGDAYFNLFSTYFRNRRKATDGLHRVDEPMGRYLPAFVSTSAIAGNDVVREMNAAADAANYDAIDSLRLSRTNFRVLYFGSDAYKERIAKKTSMFPDVITTNIVSMGSRPWLMAMKASGQEPATGRALPFSEGGQDFLSTGGFVDQLPTKFMRMLGCETNVTINTREPILSFANRYAPRIWDQDPNLVGDMLDPARTDSSDSLAFEQTDALLCSRWEAYGLKETWEMADNSYHNVVFTKNMSLAKTPELFVTKAGEMSTRNEPPRGCYQLPKERREQYSAYKTK